VVLGCENGVDMPKQVVAGIDIGGTKTAISLFARFPHALARFAFPTDPQKGPTPAIEAIIANLHRALTGEGMTWVDLAAIGVSCGGPLDADRGLIQSPPNLSTWVDVPICRILKEEFGAPCYLENDANAGALAELRFGAGQGAKDLVFLTMGTGLGAGLIINGQLHRGASQLAGEIGHVRLTRSGPVGYGRAGTVEGWASGGGMAQVARMYLGAARARGESTQLESAENLTARDVADAARKGDRVAKAVVKKVAEKLGDALAILVDVLNPERIIIGGLALRFGDDILAPARKRMMREALWSSARACMVVPAGLGEEIGDVAALCVALDGLAQSGSPFHGAEETTRALEPAHTAG
jgi:glucokinase